MKLEQFKQSKKRKKMMIIASMIAIILISTIVLVRTYAMFETKHEYNVIKGRVSNYEVNDITITSYLDGVPSKPIPLKDSEYAVEKIDCNNESKGSWNYTNWELNIQNLTTTKTKCKIYFVKKYKEPLLNGADPNGSDNLIPVVILNDGTVKKADITKQWYKYEEKIWANAVILEDENTTYQNEEVIPEANIESYFVYIPRYKYKIFNDGNYNDLTTIENKVQQIEIIFENKTTNKSNGTTVGTYITHPAFTSFDSNGLWVGKFETGYKGATNTGAAQVNSNDPSKIQIKSNIHSWNGIDISNAHLNSYNYQRNLNSHLIKNTEWGGISYLQHSKYGSGTSVRINNNSNYITGYSAASEPTCGFNVISESCNQHESVLHTKEGLYTKSYFNVLSTVSSTTGNNSGIYDMSGGLHETVFAVMKSTKGNLTSGRSATYNSGFQGDYTCATCDNPTETNLTNTTGIDFPNEKYYDIYPYWTNDLKYDRRILGDATGEMGPFAILKNQTEVSSSWYQDVSMLMHQWAPFIARGGSSTYGTMGGNFAFFRVFGNSSGYRIALSFS